MTHPSQAVEFEWDDEDHEKGNTAKLAERNISPTDIETVFLNSPQWCRNKKAATANWLMIGRDLGDRTLQIAVLWADEDKRTLRAIAGWPVPKGAHT